MSRVAIIGSGPAGCYTAQALTRLLPSVEVVVFERLPVPYGLIRYGVAGDHQPTKMVTAQFERIFNLPSVRFMGNLEVGKDIPLRHVLEAFDATVLATGLTGDRRLEVPYAAEATVIGAGELTRYFNGSPYRASLPRVGPRVCIVGAGNVAMDVVRLLAKPDGDFLGSDIPRETLRQLRGNGVSEIHILCRSRVSDARMDLSMLRELGHLPKVGFTFSGVDKQENEPRAELVREMAQSGPDARSLVHFHFQATPLAVEKGENSTLVRFASVASAGMQEIATDTVVTAIGFSPTASEADLLKQENLYKVGWARTGPRGAIPDARIAAQACAKEVVDGLIENNEKNGERYQKLMLEIAKKATSFSGWTLIDQIERSRAEPERCRAKIVSVQEMELIARQSR
jgi:ferredoxin--NADP+ reductase